MSRNGFVFVVSVSANPALGSVDRAVFATVDAANATAESFAAELAARHDGAEYRIKTGDHRCVSIELRFPRTTTHPAGSALVEVTRTRLDEHTAPRPL